MATLSEMQVYVSARLIDPNNQAVSVPQITQAINDSIRYWKFRRFWFNEKSATTTLVQGSPALIYPNDFLVPALKDDGFVLKYSGLRYPLVKINEEVYDALYIDNCQGLPRWYARLGSDEYRVFPIPNLNYDIGWHYLKEYTALANPTDTNDFTTKADRLIELWTLANLNAEIRQDTDMSTYYREMANDEYRQLNVMTTKANSSGKLEIFSNLIGGVY